MSLELALVTGLVTAAYMTHQSSEKLMKAQEEVSATVIALSYLPVIGLFYAGYSMAKNASITAMQNVYLGGLLVSVLVYAAFLFLLIKTYMKRIDEQGLDGF